jgi:transposase InsO family protein
VHEPQARAAPDQGSLLAPTARGRKRAQRLHDGTITVSVPDTLWATDATEGWTEEGRCAVFVMIDHASGEAWADAGLRMDRFAAADLLREVTTQRFGSVEAAGCASKSEFCRTRRLRLLRVQEPVVLGNAAAVDHRPRGHPDGL